MVFADSTAPGVVLRQPGQFAPGGGGPTQRSWRCGPCERESELEGYGRYGRYAQGPEAGGAATAMEESAGASTTKSIAIGVATGLSVWIVTKLLDKHLFGKGAR